MSLVLQASVTSNSPSKDVTDGANQLKARIKELELEIDELSKKYNEEIRVERVRLAIMYSCSVRV